MRQHKQLRKIKAAAGALGDRETGMGEARILYGLPMFGAVKPRVKRPRRRIGISVIVCQIFRYRPVRHETANGRGALFEPLMTERPALGHARTVPPGRARNTSVQG